MFLLDSTFLIDLHADLRRGDGAAKRFMRVHRTQPMVSKCCFLGTSFLPRISRITLMVALPSVLSVHYR